MHLKSMNNGQLSTYRHISLFLFCIFVIPLIFVNTQFFSYEPTQAKSANNAPLNELFDKNLEFLDSQDKLKKYFQEQIQERKFSDMEVVILADDLLRQRFKHGDTVVDPKDNWLLYIFNYLSGNWGNSLYTSALNPDVILKSSYAICNQQAIIFQGLMQSMGFEYLSINFNVPSSKTDFGHFASGVKIENNWYFVDTDIEPSYDRSDATVIPKLLSGDVELFNTLYPVWGVPEIPSGSIYSSSLNEFPAKRGKFLQDFTYLSSNYAWIIWLIFYFASYFFKTKQLDAE